MAAAAATARAGRASASSTTLRSLQRCDAAAAAAAAAAPAVARPSRRLASSTTNAASVASPETTSQHILSAVQRYDYPNYLCTSFYPSKEARYDYLAIRAFNVEVSNIADSVKNQQLGKVRFQWWREAIQSMTSNKPVPHPTVLALYEAFKRNKLSSYHFSRIIDAKERNLLSPTYNSLSDLTSYAQATSLSLLSLQLQVLTSSATRRAVATSKVADIPLSTIDHSLSHLATYISIAQLLRSIHYFAGQKRQLVIPRDIASSHGVIEEQVYRALPSLAGKSPELGTDPQKAFHPVIEACSELVALAEKERLKARWTLGLEESQDEEHRELAQGRKLSSLPKELRPLFLSAVPAKNFFETFTKTADYNPFHPVCMQQQSRNWKLPLQMLYANYRGQF